MYENLERTVAVSLAGGVYWKDQREAKSLIFNTKPQITCSCEERDGEIHTLIPFYNHRQNNQVNKVHRRQVSEAQNGMGSELGESGRIFCTPL